MGYIAETAVKVTADTKGFHSEVSRGVLGSVTRVAAGAAGIFGGIQLGKGLFNATIKSAADFQTTLKVLQATTGASNSDLQRLSATAQRLGADVKLPGTSAKSAADAMLQLGRAGFTTNQTIAATRGVLLLSTAAQVDNATAADMVSKAIGAFGLKAKDANTVVNDFAGAANASQSSLADVGMAVTQAGAGFHALHIPVSDAATAIAEMAKQGITGGMAGAALNVAFTRLATPTKAAATVMKDMGVQLFDNHGKFVGLRGAIEQMSPKLAAMTDQQRLHTLSVLGGTRGMKALADVLGVGVKNWDRTRAAVTRAGQAQAIANAQMSGFHGAVLGLQNSLGALALKIGIAVLPQVTNLVRWLGRIAAAPSFSIAVKIAWTGIKEFAGNVSQALSDALFGSNKVVHVGGGSPHVEVDAGLIAAIQRSISDGIAATDWSVVGSRIGTAISAAIKISSDAINGMLNGMMNWLTGHKDQIAEIGLVIGLTMVSKLLDPSFWIAHWQLIGGIALSAITIMFPEGKLAEIGLRAMGFLLTPFRLLGTRLLALGTEGVLSLSTAVERGVGTLGGKIALWIGDAILRATSASVTAMVNLGAKIIEAIINKVSGLNVLFRTAIFTAVVTVIGTIIGAAVSKAAELASGVAKSILSVIQKLAALGGNLVSAVVGAVHGALGGARSAAESVASAIAGGIKTAAGKLAGLAGDLVGRISAAAGQAAGQAFSAMRQVGFAVADGVVSGIGNLASRVASAVGNAAKGAVGGALSLIGAKSPSRLYADTVGNAIGTGVTTGVVTSLNSLGSQMGAKLAAVAQQVATITKANQGTVAKAVKDWATAAKTAFDDEASKLKDVLGKHLDAAKARIDAWKAQLTPAEVQLKTEAAHKALADLQTSLNAAWTALKALPQQQADQMTALLNQQKATMDQLVATQRTTLTDASIAQHEYEKGITANASDPLALGLVQAQQNLITQRQLYDQGAITLDQLLAYQDAFDQASIMAANDTDAQKLLQDYNTWQGLATQAATQGDNIAATEAANFAARNQLQTDFTQQTIDATNTKDNALNAIINDNLNAVAAMERADRDRAATELNAALVTRYQRIVTHWENVKTITDRKLQDMADDTTKSGHVIGDNLAQALRDTIPNIAGAAAAVARELQKYLKTNSPTEAGPMRDLDTWWSRLAPTLLASLDSSGIKAALTDATTPGYYPGQISRAPGATGASSWSSARMELLLERIEKHTQTTAQKPDPVAEVHVAGSVGIDASTYRARRV